MFRQRMKSFSIGYFDQCALTVGWPSIDDTKWLKSSLEGERWFHSIIEQVFFTSSAKIRADRCGRVGIWKKIRMLFSTLKHKIFPIELWLTAECFQQEKLPNSIIALIHHQQISIVSRALDVSPKVTHFLCIDMICPIVHQSILIYKRFIWFLNTLCTAINSISMSTD